MGLTIGWVRLPAICGTWYIWYGMTIDMLVVILGVTSTADTITPQAEGRARPVDTMKTQVHLKTPCMNYHEQPHHEFLPETMNWHALSNPVFPPSKEVPNEAGGQYHINPVCSRYKATYPAVLTLCARRPGERNTIIRSCENIVVMSISPSSVQIKPCIQWSKCMCSPVAYGTFPLLHFGIGHGISTLLWSVETIWNLSFQMHIIWSVTSEKGKTWDKADQYE